MKYYSEITKTLYEDEKALIGAELKAKEAAEERKKAIEKRKEQVQKLQEQRASRAKEVEDSYTIADAAQKDADRLLSEFLRDYGSFHSTTREVKPRLTIMSFLESLFL